MKHEDIVAAAKLDTAALSTILSPERLRELTGLSLTTIWRLRRRGDLPNPLQLSPGRVGWRASDIQTWLAGRGEAK